jgi:hypothetical protein
MVKSCQSQEYNRGIGTCGDGNRYRVPNCQQFRFHPSAFVLFFGKTSTHRIIFRLPVNLLAAVDDRNTLNCLCYIYPNRVKATSVSKLACSAYQETFHGGPDSARRLMYHQDEWEIDYQIRRPRGDQASREVGSQ